MTTHDHVARARLDVDYAHTSERPSWSLVPTDVHAAVGRLSGSPVTEAAEPVSSGFTGSYAGQVTCSSGRRMFVQAAGPQTPHGVDALHREAEVLERLPAGIPAPGLVGFAGTNGWNVLVLEVVDGRMPGQPWTAADIDAAHDACLTVARLGSPTALGGRDYAQRIADDPAIVTLGRALVDGSYRVTPELPPWLGVHGREVGALVLDAPGRFDGDTLSHGDLRPDNLIVRPDGRAVVLDWNWVGVAAPWLDWVGLLPMIAWQGVDTEALVRRSPLTRDVDPEAVDSFLACIAAYILDGFRKEPPPGCLPVLGRHQLAMAHMFLELLRTRRRWT